VATQSEIVALGYNSDGTIHTTPANYSNTYDLAGNLAEAVDANGQAIVFGYSSTGGETGETWYPTAALADAGTGSDGSESFTNDVEGNMATASNSVGTSSLVAAYNFQYAGPGKMTSENIDLGGMSTAVTLASTYDYNGNRKTLAATVGETYSDGTVSGGTPDFLNTYSTDAIGNMNGVTQTGQTGGNGVTAKSVSLFYNLDQQVSTIDAYEGDGGTQVYHAAYGYDNASELKDLVYTPSSSSTTPLAAYHWDYTGNGLVQDEYSYKDRASGASATDHTTWAKATFGYDHDAELTSTSYSANFNSPPATNTGNAYDHNGNRVPAALPAVIGSATGAGNRMLFDGTYYFAFDANGNRIARWINTHSSAEGSPQAGDTSVTIYTWNEKNELTKVNFYATYGSPSSSDWEIDYGYDSFGQMVTRTPSSSLTGESAENFIYDGGNIALVLNSGGQVVDRELDGPAVDQVFASEAVTPVESGAQAAGTVNWYLGDNQGTVRDVVQLDGTTPVVENHLDYDSSGQVTSRSSSTAAHQPIATYDGTWQDPDTKLDKMGARWYDAVDGVFASQDPLGFGGGQTNTEEYAGNSPTNFTDPSGLQVKGTELGGFGSCGCAIGRPIGIMDISGGRSSGGGIPVIEPVCFAAGTSILMADGTTKPIEKIERGDKVRAAFHEDPEGAVNDGEVVEVYHHGPRSLVEVEIGGHLIRATPKHPFYVRSRGWTAASELRVGDSLRTALGEFLPVGSVADNGRYEPVYNFQVATLHTYFVGNREGHAFVLVHNQSGKEDGAKKQMDFPTVDESIRHRESVESLVLSNGSSVKFAGTAKMLGKPMKNNTAPGILYGFRVVLGGLPSEANLAQLVRTNAVSYFRDPKSGKMFALKDPEVVTIDYFKSGSKSETATLKNSKGEILAQLPGNVAVDLQQQEVAPVSYPGHPEAVLCDVQVNVSLQTFQLDGSRLGQVPTDPNDGFASISTDGAILKANHAPGTKGKLIGNAPAGTVIVSYSYTYKLDGNGGKASLNFGGADWDPEGNLGW
jgi:RHS repeat-associated protein